jgi:hypothetical protein
MSAGRRGPGMPGSAQSFPGEYASPAAGFASGKPLDTAPGCAVLGSFLEQVAGEDDRYAGASDDELLGVISGWDRVEANACARKHAAAAELIRRPSASGNIGEFVAAKVLAIQLMTSGSHPGHDGVFTAGPQISGRGPRSGVKFAAAGGSGT